MSKEVENERNVQKTAKDLANLINRFVNFSELEKLINNLFNTKEMYEIFNFLSNHILKHLFPNKKEVKSYGKKEK